MEGMGSGCVLPWVKCAGCRACRVTGRGGRCRVAGWMEVGDVSRRRQCLYYEREPERRGEEMRGISDRLSELEARYHKAQAEAWQRRARQLEGDNLVLHDRVDMLQGRLARYRAKVGGLKEENERLREKLELVLKGGK